MRWWSSCGEKDGSEEHKERGMIFFMIVVVVYTMVFDFSEMEVWLIALLRDETLGTGQLRK